jgi:hypothetical protein
LSTGKDFNLGRMIEQGIHRNPNKIYQHYLHHRPQAGHGCGYRSTHEGAFTDRGGQNSLFSETREKIDPYHLDIFAQYNDSFIIGHGMGQSILDGIRKRHGSHWFILPKLICFFHSAFDVGRSMFIFLVPPHGL